RRRRRRAPVTLRDLLLDVAGTPPFGADAAERAGAAAGETVTGVAYDSRLAAPGSIFVALRGLHADGTTFAADSITRGAVPVVGAAGGGVAPAGVGAPWLRVGDARLALGALAAAFYRHPSRELTLVGITGTNGKTTTSYVLASIFEAAGIRSGRIGTVGYRVG